MFRYPKKENTNNMTPTHTSFLHSIYVQSFAMNDETCHMAHILDVVLRQTKFSQNELHSQIWLRKEIRWSPEVDACVTHTSSFATRKPFGRLSF